MNGRQSRFHCQMDSEKFPIRYNIGKQAGTTTAICEGTGLEKYDVSSFTRFPFVFLNTSGLF